MPGQKKRGARKFSLPGCCKGRSGQEEFYLPGNYCNVSIGNDHAGDSGGMIPTKRIGLFTVPARSDQQSAPGRYGSPDRGLYLLLHYLPLPGTIPAKRVSLMMICIAGPAGVIS